MMMLAAMDLGEGAIIGAIVIGFGTLLGVLSKWNAERDRIVKDAVAAAMAKIGVNSQTPKTQILNQPLVVSEHHEKVSKPEYDKEIGEVWQVINGIRKDVGTTSKNVAVMTALREDNGKRLEHMEGDMKDMNHKMGQLVQSLHDLNRRASK